MANIGEFDYEYVNKWNNNFIRLISYEDKVITLLIDNKTNEYQYSVIDRGYLLFCDKNLQKRRKLSDYDNLKLYNLICEILIKMNNEGKAIYINDKEIIVGDNCDKDLIKCVMDVNG